jgi:hypothetical protein
MSLSPIQSENIVGVILCLIVRDLGYRDINMFSVELSAYDKQASGQSQNLLKPQENQQNDRKEKSRPENMPTDDAVQSWLIKPLNSPVPEFGNLFTIPWPVIDAWR